MGKISLLDPTTINQIAAGEVVENSSSVVKELIENSLDANATFIEVETIGGGQGFISIKDNGDGMTSLDLDKCLLRHATSKISSFDDLYSLNSFGFRGEAIPSIASVSKMRLCSSCAESEEGSYVYLEGGTILEKGVKSRAKGTTIEVTSLFFNVPARRKFQNSQRSDTNKIRKIIETQMLMTDGVGWRWCSDNGEEINVLADDGFEERINKVLGSEFAASGVLIDHSDKAMSIKGMLGKPSFHKSNRGYQRLFINGRSVESFLISKMVLSGFGHAIPEGRFPGFVLNICLPPDCVDVNVHPQKKEVRFSEDNKIMSIMHSLIRKSLTSGVYFYSSKEEVSFNASLTTIDEMIDQDDGVNLSRNEFHKPLNESSGVNESLFLRNSDLPVQPVRFERGDYKNDKNIDTADYNENKHTNAAVVDIPPITIDKTCNLVLSLGSLSVLEDANGAYILDLNVLRRHLMYIMMTSTVLEVSIQSVCSPIMLELSSQESKAVLSNFELFHRIGVCIKHFGGLTFLINACPSCLSITEIKPWIEGVISALALEPEVNEERIIIKSLKGLKSRNFKLNCNKYIFVNWEVIGRPVVAYDGSVISSGLQESDLKNLLLRGSRG